MAYYNLLKDIPDSQKFPPKGYSSSNYPQTASGTITSAEILALNTTPQVLITGQDGAYIIPIRAFFFNDHGGTDYAASGDFSIRYTDGSGDALFNVLPEVAFVEAAADAVQFLTPIDCIPVSGASVVLSADTADPTTGDGEIDYIIEYRVVTI